MVFDGNITSKTQKFLFSWSDSTCYTVFVLISTSSTTFFLASSPASAAILNSALCLSSVFGHCTQKEFKVTLKYHASCEVDHTCVWSQSLKKMWSEIFLASPPFSVGPCPMWSNLEPQKQGETIWKWGNANNVAPHLMCLKCLWPARLALWSATNLMLPQVQGDIKQTDRRKNTGTWKYVASQEARTTEEKVHLVSCYVF